jgi:hypothetical protein
MLRLETSFIFAMNTLAVMERFLASANPGANLVDHFPSLDRLPDFLAPWRAAALHQQKVTQSCYMGLLKEVKEKISHGELAHDGVFAARLLQDKDRFQMDDLDVAYLAGTMLVNFTCCVLSCDLCGSTGLKPVLKPLLPHSAPSYLPLSCIPKCSKLLKPRLTGCAVTTGLRWTILTTSNMYEPCAKKHSDGELSPPVVSLIVS